MAELRYDLSYLDDPRIFALGRMDAFSDHDIYLNSREADARCSSLVASLDGRWRFHYAPDINSLPAGFEAADFDASGWDEIDVPGHIQLQGYGGAQYVDVQYPWDGHEELKPPLAPRANPTGSYRRSFRVPDAWRGMRVILTFHGVEAAFFCWVNGELAGYAEDGFTPSRFDITGLLRPGENALAVQVYHYASCSWIEDQDFWRFSGIFRSVELTAWPRAHVRDIFARAELSDGFDAAELSVEAALDLDERGARVLARLMDERGVCVAERSAPAEARIELRLPVDHPALWSAEEPRLYALRIALADAQGEELEVAQTSVGFRRFEIRGGVMLLNGRRILLRGVNRHEYSPKKGRAISKEEMYADIAALKRANINAVRTSHYPNQSLWYRLCDEYGIYLIDEANFESHGTWCFATHRDVDGAVPKDRPEWRGALLDRARSMQERDKNHPSIIMWSCGNESAGGRVIFDMAEYMRRRDPSRIVHYEGVADDRSYNDTSDVESRMYMPAARIRQWLTEHREKPFMLCEYSHAMGNSCGALNKYLALEDEFEQYQGGFIWDFIDQALDAAAPNGRPRLAYGGDFGDRPTEREFCGNGIFFADRTPSPKLQEVKFLYQPVRIAPDAGGVLLDNRALFANTCRYELKWRLMEDGRTVRTGSVDAPDVPPGQARYFALELGEMSGRGEYALHCGLHLRQACAWADCGYELMHGSAVVRARLAPALNRLPARAILGDYNVGFDDGAARFMFSYKEGGLSSMRAAGGPELIMTALRPSLYRAPTDNDVANLGDRDAAFWQAVCDSARGELTAPEYMARDCRVRVKYELPFARGARMELSCAALGAGRLLVEVDYAGAPGLPDMSALGVALCLPRSVNRLRYYGLGPDENYCDRMCGAYLGEFETDAQRNFTPYLRPQECGNRQGVRWCELTDEAGRGLRVDCVSEPLAISVLPYSPAQLRAARHPDELPEPCYTFLDIALKRMGVGGDNTWGAPVHEEFHIRASEDMRFAFILSAI